MTLLRILRVLVVDDLLGTVSIFYGHHRAAMVDKNGTVPFAAYFLKIKVIDAKILTGPFFDRSLLR
jgi:hypothetical protein